MEASLPVSDFSFRIAATSGATSYPHVDYGGLGTVMEMLCGQKIWAFGRPLPGLSAESPNFWHQSSGFDGNSSLIDRVHWSYFLLEAGDVL